MVRGPRGTGWKREGHFHRGGRAFWFECKSDFPCKKLENVKAIRSRVTEPREEERMRTKERKKRWRGVEREEGWKGSRRNRETTDRWEGRSNIIAFAKEVANLPFTVGQRDWKCLLERKLFNTNPRTTSGFESVEEDRFQPSTPSPLTYPFTLNLPLLLVLRFSSLLPCSPRILFFHRLRYTNRFFCPVIDYRYLLPAGQPFSPIYPHRSPIEPWTGARFSKRLTNRRNPVCTYPGERAFVQLCVWWNHLIVAA